MRGRLNVSLICTLPVQFYVHAHVKEKAGIAESVYVAGLENQGSVSVRKSLSSTVSRPALDPVLASCRIVTKSKVAGACN
jgi:hypothetical protein